jgi:hypothetical protein
MKIKSTKTVSTPYGTKITIKRFAWFPVKLWNTDTTIWFESYLVDQIWEEQGSNRVRYRGMFFNTYYDGWRTLNKYQK